MATTVLPTWVYHYDKAGTALGHHLRPHARLKQATCQITQSRIFQMQQAYRKPYALHGRRHVLGRCRQGNHEAGALGRGWGCCTALAMCHACAMHWPYGMSCPAHMSCAIPSPASPPPIWSTSVRDPANRASQQVRVECCLTLCASIQ
jgi:hypothetical protein